MRKNYVLSLLMTLVLLWGGQKGLAQTLEWSSDGLFNDFTPNYSNASKGFGSDYTASGITKKDGNNTKVATGKNAYDLQSDGNYITFNIPSTINNKKYDNFNVTLGVFLPYNTTYYISRQNYNIVFDNTAYSLSISRSDFSLGSIWYTLRNGWFGTISNTTTYKLVTIPVKLTAGTHTISFDSNKSSTRVGLFYIKVKGSTETDVSDKNKNTSVSLQNITVPEGTTLGLWKRFKVDGMSLYLGGWKYQSDSDLADKYTRHSEDYLDPSYDNDIDYDDPNTPNTPTKHDEWEHPEDKYNFGNEDPYYRDNDCKYTEYKKDAFTKRRELTQPPYSEYYTQYAYNTIDNGRNEYIESTGDTKYTGRYRFKEAENSQEWGERIQGDPFTVPCMGDFIKLEPECDGKVTLYLMQNGSIDYDVSSYRQNDVNELYWVDAANSYYGKWRGGLLSKVCWRPVFIVDEAGYRFSDKDVTAETNNFITIGREDGAAYVYDSNNKKAVLCQRDDNNDLATTTPAEYRIRTSVNVAGFVTDKSGNVVTDKSGIVYPVRFTYQQCFNALNKDKDIYGNAKSAEEIKADQAHYAFFTKKFEKNSDGTVGAEITGDTYDNTNVIKVWPESVETTGKIIDGTDDEKYAYMRGRVWGPKYTGDGWVIISKGYVKYEFDVKAGKSYYVFANDTKIGFCGYEFKKGDAPSGELKLSDKDGNPPLPKEATTYAAVTLTDRTFKPGWNAICLPFSMNETKMRDWFGTNGQETYELVTYNGVGRDANDENHLKAFFFHHVYQDIIAGYPYMLWIPSGAKALLEVDPDKKKYFTVNNVTVDINTDLWSNFTTSHDYMPKEVNRLYISAEKDCFTFHGFYNPTQIQKADYYVVPDGLQLFTDDQNLIRGYRAFLFNNEWRNNTNGVKEMIRLSGTNFNNAVDEMDNVAWENATVINDLAEEMGFFQQPQNVYNVNGQLIRANSTSLVGLPKGIYIVNGKKYLVK